MTWLDDIVAYAEAQVDDRVREAYWSRGADDNQIKLYRLGYIDRSLPEVELPEDFLRWSGHGEKLVDSYVFPLTNALGQIRGLQFRAVERSVRGYMDYFADDTEAILFGLGQAAQAMWTTGKVCLVEGTFDLFPIQRVSPDVVATLTAKVTLQFVRVVRRLCRRVYLSYDQDNTGRLGTSKFIRAYGKDFDEVVPIEYPQVTTIDGKVAKDPSEIWEAWGDERLSSHLRCLTSSTPESEIQNAPEFF